MPRWVRAPTIIAEALVGVSDPLLSALCPMEEASPGEVAAALAQSLALPEASDSPPGWLLPEQVSSFRRIIAALRTYHGALLADPVGSGKTYVALAAALLLNRGPTACIVPATLVGQWEATASRVAVPIVLSSHEQVSRGRLPWRTRGLVIIDESHRFRNPNTRRYGHMARWLVGRPALLVTATPVVNRLEDVASQLLLAVRDTALSSEGVVSIRQALTRASPLPSLGRIVIEADTAPSHRPQRVAISSAPSISECRRLDGSIDMLDTLRLSRCPPIARLIRGTLLRAAGSSPAALAGALRRYQRLLLHARDAAYAGQRFDRAELRRFTAVLGDQLVWWELFPDSGAEPEIELGDLELTGSLIATAESAAEEPDPKVERLRNILHDGLPTLVFTTSRDTVRHLRRQLSELRIAWCTGDQAGIGAARAPRERVLAWFGQPTNAEHTPQHLVVTDVAAEGLDLQRAARVVHYDLPWTPMRLEQREGRSVRRGSHNREVEVIRFHPPQLLETRLNSEAILARKIRLPGLAGLGPEGRMVWRWRPELAAEFAGWRPRRGIAWVPDDSEGLLAGFALYRRDDPVPLAVTLLWMGPDRSWTETPEIIQAHLRRTAAEPHSAVPAWPRVREWLTALAQPIRERLMVARGWKWITPTPTPAARQLLIRLQRSIADAARQHQPTRLACVERVLAFLSDGHTAGEEMLIELMADRSESQIFDMIQHVLRTGDQWAEVEARLTGLIVFGPAQVAASALGSPECRS